MTTHDDDTDPTGMRALLRGLPDPGPMPAELISRIQASLADLSDGSDPGVTERDGARALGNDGDSDVSRGTPVPHRSSWLARNGSKLAVAAVVIVGGGAVATGPLGLLGSGNDSSTESSDSADSAGSGAEGLSDSPDAAPRAADGDDNGAESSMKVAPSGPVVVTMSGRRYTSAGLADEIGSAPTTPPLAPLAAESPGIGPIGTELGARPCLQALGFPRATAATVDLAFVDDVPAAIVVVTTGGERTAYAVGRDCSLGDPAVIVGPIALP